jgi:hypothetical protein
MTLYGKFRSMEEMLQYQREQGLLQHVLRLMREVKQTGGEKCIYCSDPTGKTRDVEIIIRCTSEVSSRGIKSIEAPT